MCVWCLPFSCVNGTTFQQYHGFHQFDHFNWNSGKGNIRVYIEKEVVKDIIPLIKEYSDNQI